MPLATYRRRWLVVASAALLLLVPILFDGWWGAEAWLATIAPLVLALAAAMMLEERSQRSKLLHRLDVSEQRFLSIAEASVSGILIFNAAGKLVFANRRWAELTGAPLSFDNGREWLESVAADDRMRLVEAWRHTLATGQRSAAQVAFRRANSDEGTSDLIIDAERDRGGQVTHVIVRLTDQTARAWAENALVEREKLYRLLAEHGSDLILRLTGDGLIQFASQAAERILGVDPATLVGQPLLTRIHPDDWAPLCRQLGGAGELSPIAFRIRTAHLGDRWVETSLDRVGDNGEWVASLRDIAVRRAAEESREEAERKLRESNRLLTLAEGLANFGHWHADAAGAVVFSSEAQAILRIPEPHCSFASTLALVDPADRQTLLRAIAHSARNVGSRECQLRLQVSDEGSRIILVRLHADRTSDGAVATFGVVTDITDRLAADARLKTALEEARAAADAKATFLATMSHEISTPMTGVLGMIELLRAEASPAERASYLDTLEQSADLLMTVLNDILEFSQLDGGHLELSARPFDLRDAIVTTIRLFERTAAAKGLQLRLDWRADEQATVIGDRVRLQQVLSNLLSNAIRFTDEGIIIVSASARAGRKDLRQWRIAVRDRGVGISVEDQARLFEPFMQAERGADRRFDGTGLGLAISRRLVDGMGGKLRLRSVPGKGSTFWIEIGLAAAPTDEVPAPAPTHLAIVPARLGADSFDVLLAEDNRVNQLLITALLRRLGHRVTCAPDGQEAVAAAKSRRFDLILLDMQMPRLDGLSAALAIRQSAGPSAAIPIVALTADASPQRRLIYAVDEIDAFLAKPIDTAMLSALFVDLPRRSVTRTMSRRAAAHELDRHQLAELREALGPDRIAQLLALFAHELTARPAAIRRAMGRSDLASAAAEAHSLKGAALSIGGRSVGNAAAAIEQVLGTAAPHQAERLHDALRELDRAVASTIAALPQEVVAAPCAA